MFVRKTAEFEVVFSSKGLEFECSELVRDGRFK